MKMRFTYIVTCEGFPMAFEYQGDSVHWDPKERVTRIYSGAEDDLITRELRASCINVIRWRSARKWAPEDD